MPQSGLTSKVDIYTVQNLFCQTIIVMSAGVFALIFCYNHYSDYSKYLCCQSLDLTTGITFGFQP